MSGGLEDGEPRPWSLRARRLGLRSVLGVGAGALVASFFIGTGDITVATQMGALFGFDLWWSYFVLGLAGWALMDMSIRYFLSTGRTPAAIFKELHPLLALYLLVTVVVTTTVGAYSQWNACAHVLSGFFPSLPSELGGALAAFTGLAAVCAGAYRRIEAIFLWGLVALVLLFLLAAVSAGVSWNDAALGLVPRLPARHREECFSLLQSNAGSLINAWLILVYPYTMREKGWRSPRVQDQVDILHRARWDCGVGVLAAAFVALPILAAARSVAMPFGIVPRNGAEFAALLEPLAGEMAMVLFLGGLFLAAWTSGVGWIVCGVYTILDLGNLEARMDSRRFRLGAVIFTVFSSVILFLRVNPFDGIRIFAAFLTVVTPVVALALVARVSRRDMGYYRWWPRSVRGCIVIALDLYAVAVSVLVGWALVARWL